MIDWTQVGRRWPADLRLSTALETASGLSARAEALILTRAGNALAALMAAIGALLPDVAACHAQRAAAQQEVDRILAETNAWCGGGRAC